MSGPPTGLPPDDGENAPSPDAGADAGAAIASPSAGAAGETVGAGAGEALFIANQLCFSVYAAAHAFGRVYRPLLDPLGVTYPQYLVLLSLWEADGRTVTSLGDALGLDSGTLTPLLKRLAAAGLVERRRSRDDEREVHVTLTEAGRALRSKAVGIPAAIGCAAGGDRAAIGRLKSGLDRLRADLDVASAAPGPATRRRRRPP